MEEILSGRQPHSGYKVGTYLDTYIKFKTKYAQDFKNNKDFRKTVWDRLNIRDKH